MNDLKDRGARLIIGEFFENTARKVMCAAYELDMTQRNGYIWFLPGWFKKNWYDFDEMRTRLEEMRDELSETEEKEMEDSIPHCTTAQMVEVRKAIKKGYFCDVVFIFFFLFRFYKAIFR